MIQIHLSTGAFGESSQSADVSTLEGEILAAAFKPFPRIVADFRGGVVHSRPPIHCATRRNQGNRGDIWTEIRNGC